MRCFYHPDDREAVATCINCSRGLCTECAASLPNATACANRCEAEVLAIKEMMERGKTGYQKAATLQKRNGLLYLLMALGMIGVGALTLPAGWFMIVLGAVFLFGAAFHFAAARKFLRVGA